VTLLEEALAFDPSAASLHSPLANAYRGLGDEAQAEAHLKQWRNTEVLVPDRLRIDLDMSLESGLSYELRGVRALEARDFKAAEGFFRKGVELTPTTTALGRSLRHKLGTALILQGDVAGAMARFEEVAKLAPAEGLDEASAKANYSLGVVMASSGSHERCRAAAFGGGEVQPQLRRGVDGARRHVTPDGPVRRLSQTVRRCGSHQPSCGRCAIRLRDGLVRLRRYRDARDWLAEGARVQPDRAELSHALARLLAAAPDDGVRDGAQAMTLVQALMKGTKTTALGETMAMALAEQGQFADAVQVQRDVMSSAQKAGLEPDVRRMTDNLRRYERGQACRVPWRDDESVHIPGMFASAAPAAPTAR
jgi:tetratricopeptide (TPR) repeat protein